MPLVYVQTRECDPLAVCARRHVCPGGRARQARPLPLPSATEPPGRQAPSVKHSVSGAHPAREKWTARLRAKRVTEGRKSGTFAVREERRKCARLSVSGVAGGYPK